MVVLQGPKKAGFYKGAERTVCARKLVGDTCKSLRRTQIKIFRKSEIPVLAARFARADGPRTGLLNIAARAICPAAFFATLSGHVRP
jgi:hypothetical protein